MDSQIEIPDLDDDPSANDSSFDFSSNNNFGSSSFSSSGFGLSLKRPQQPFAQPSWSSSGSSTPPLPGTPDVPVFSHHGTATGSPFASGSAGGRPALLPQPSSSASLASSSNFPSASVNDPRFLGDAAPTPGHASTAPTPAKSPFSWTNKSSEASLTGSQSATTTTTSKQKSVSGHGPYELALFIVCDAFIERAEEKISDALGRPIDQDLYLPRLLADGVDPHFDKLLHSIAHISKKIPRHAIKLIERWRDAQSDPNAVRHAAYDASMRSTAETLAERKSLATQYIVSRLLLAVAEAVTRDSLGDEAGPYLEGMVYHALKSIDPGQVERSHNRRANLDQYAKIIGALSLIRFQSVTDRFLADLQHIHAASKETEPRLEQLIRGMRCILIRVFPMEAFEEAAEFMESLSGIFEATQSSRLRCALAVTMNQIISPIALTASAEANNPLWVKAMHVIHARTTAMAAKPRFLSVALPLICSSVASSPEEVLLANFQPSIDLCFARLKERSTRLTAFYGLLQLLHAYLRRCHETHSAMSKRLDPMIKIIFPPGRKTIHPSDVAADQMAVIPHLIFQHHFEYGAELLTTLLHPTTPVGSDRWPLEALCYERMHCGVRGLMYSLDVTENNREMVMPHMPEPADADTLAPEPPPPVISVEPLSEGILGRVALMALVDTSSAAIARIAAACSRACDAYHITDDRNILSRNGAPVFHPFASERGENYIQRRHGAFMVTFPRERLPLFELLRICIDSWPRLLAKPNAVADFNPADILIRNLLHVDINVYHTARKALDRLLRLADGHQYLLAMTRFVAKSDLLLRETSSLQGASTVKLESLIALWNDLVDSFFTQVHIASEAHTKPVATSSLGGRRFGGSLNEEKQKSSLEGTDPALLFPVLIELEATAVVLLVSQSALIRRRAADVIRVVAHLDAALVKWQQSMSETALPTNEPRVLKVLEEANTALLADIEDIPLNSAERNRLAWWKQQPSDSAILRLTESDSLIDLGLWHHLISPLLSLLSTRSPSLIAQARPLFATRLLKAYPIASTAAGLVPGKTPAGPPTARGGAPYAPMPSADIRLISDHWRTHLTALCTITKNQLSSQSGPTPPPEPGTQVDVERLNSGADIVRLAVPFLASDELLLREASVVGLGCINISAYRALLEGLNSIVRHLVQDYRLRQDPRMGSRASARHARLHVAVARVHEVSSRLLRSASIGEGELAALCSYVQDTLLLVQEPETADEPLRRAYSICVLNLVDYCGTRGILKQCLPVHCRQQLFSLFNSWSHKAISPATPESRNPKLLDNTARSHSKSRSGNGSHGANSAHEIFLPAVSAIASLCEHDGLELKRDSSDKAGLDAHDVMNWCQTMFETANEKAHLCARRAVGGLIANNLNNRSFLDVAVYQSFAEPEALALHQSTFSNLSGAMITENAIAVKSSTIVCLALWKLGSPDLPTRQRAYDVLRTKLGESISEEVNLQSQSAIYSVFTGAVLQARLDLTSLIAGTQTIDARSVFLELAIRILQIGNKQTRLLMQLLPYWLQLINLPPVAASATSDPVLANLFLLSAKYGEVYQNEIRAMWTSIASQDSPNNLRFVLRFLVEETSARGSKEFTRHSQRIVGCLCQSQAAPQVLSALNVHVTPASILPQSDSKPQGAGKRTNLDTLFPINPRRMPLAEAQSAVLLAGDAIMSQLHASDGSIIKFLHVLFLHLDHTTIFIRTQARDVILRFLTLLNKLSREDHTQTSIKALRTADTQWSWVDFWEYPEGSSDNASRRVVKNMQSMLADAVPLLERTIPDARKLWGAVALEWANNCPSRHMACRSFQSLRLLMPHFTQPMLVEILSRLFSTISDEAPDARLFAREILHTLISIGEVGDTPLHDLPSLWWAFIACATTSNEEEVACSLQLGQSLLKRLGESPSTASSIMSYKPEDWAPVSDSFSCYIVRSVRSSTTLQPCWDFVQKILQQPSFGSVADPIPTLHHIYVVTLLWGLDALETSNVTSQLESHCNRLAEWADSLQEDGLARVARSLGKNRFRTKEDFIRQAIANMREYFPVRDQVDTLVIFLGALHNSLYWVRERSLVLLKSFLQQVRLTEEDVESLGRDLVSPLIHMLTTDLAGLALDVLEEPVPLVEGARPQPDDHSIIPAIGFLRKSSSTSNFNSCFGKPTKSGWSVASPAEDAQETRDRLHEVVDMCGSASAESVNSPFSFAVEDSMVQDPLAESKSYSETGDASTLGEMVSTLHELGSFFDDELSSSPAFRISQSVGSASRVAAVLARSVCGNSSSAPNNKRMSVTTSMSTIPEFPPPFSDPLVSRHREDSEDADDEGGPQQSTHVTWETQSERETDTDASSIQSFGRDPGGSPSKRRSKVFNWTHRR